jgi:hypothetical protein
MQSKDVAVLFVLLSLFVTMGWGVYLLAETRKRRDRIQAQAELNRRLLDKFGSAQEIVEFFETPGGAQLMESLASDREAPANAILRSTHRGIILAIVAVGCLGLAWYYRADENPLLVIGVLLLCLGIGFLVSAVVSHQLSKSLPQ